jgi:hypothetical protein
MPTELFDLKTVLPYFILIGTVTALIAHRKRGRQALPWFFLGFFFGCLAIIALFMLPQRTTPSQPVCVRAPLSTPKPGPSFKSISSPSTPMVEELWYFLAEDRAQIGPVSFYGLKQCYKEGRLTTSSYVWNAGLEEWKKLEELPDYVSLLEERLT